MGPNVARRCLIVGALAAALIAPPIGVRAQPQPQTEPAEEATPGYSERYKALARPEGLEALEKLDKETKERAKPPFEFVRSRVAPFDVLPLVKSHHWSTLGLELKANHSDYDGVIQTGGVRLLGFPRSGDQTARAEAVIFQRGVHLPKAQAVQPGMQVFLPSIPRQLPIDLTQPDSIRPEATWPVPLRPLLPHQSLIVVLAHDPNPYNGWGRFYAMRPLSGNSDPAVIDIQRYYRLVIPLTPDKPVLSPNPLTWSTISHVIWDGLSPDALNLDQQQALIDWIHWGGQLTIVGGAGPSFAPLQDSFLGPYLPADPSGRSALLTQSDLEPMALDYHPVRNPDLMGANGERETPEEGIHDPKFEELDHLQQSIGSHYKSAAPIRPAPKRPVFFAGLVPRPEVGARTLGLGSRAEPITAVERRVGRGRVTMLAFNPTDPAFAAWPGLDTWVRRVVLRRPEEFRADSRHDPAQGSPGASSPFFRFLSGPELTWVRYLARDLGIPDQEPTPAPVPLEGGESGTAATPAISPPGAVGYRVTRPLPPPGSSGTDPDREHISTRPVGAWLDDAALPRTAREMLDKSSGIAIPSDRFVLKVILAYVLALVPLNWLVCRYLLRRRELAWVVVPILALGFAIGVERAAAYDLGYDLACSEVDLLEVYGEYPRAHLSRFASLYSSARTRFTISYPENPTALALPLDTGLGIRGGDVAESVFQSYPVPALVGFPVQPRSLGMFRAEEMTPLGGTIRLEKDASRDRIWNRTELVLRDAVLVDVAGGQQTPLGTIAAGARVDVGAARDDAIDPANDEQGLDKLVPGPFLDALRRYDWARPEDAGELRLVAWVDRPFPGQKIEPAVDQHRGFSLVVAHLRMGPPPSPDTKTYDRIVDEFYEPRPVRRIMGRLKSTYNRILGGFQETRVEAEPPGPAAAAGPGSRRMTPR